MKYLLLFLPLIQCFSADAGRKMNNVSPTPPAIVLYVNKAAVGANDGSSWTDAYTNLQDALANTSPGISQIWVAKGTYYPDEGGGKTDNDRNSAFAMKNNLAIYGGFAGTETLLSQRNWRTNVTVLSGDIDKNDGPAFANNAGNSYHVVNNPGNSLDNTATLDGFTISGGNANGVDAEGASGTQVILSGGGGMYNSNSSPAVVNCTFSGNSADFGGGMYNEFFGPSITNCIFSANRGQLGGGGIYSNQAGPIVTNSSFSGNTTNGKGGGMYLQGYPSLSPTVINCSFSGNSAPASEGGGLFIQGGGATIDDVALPVTNCIFWGNSSEIDVFDLDAGPIVTYSIVKGGFTGTGNLNVDPLFVNAVNGNLHLQAVSPAINVGNDTANNQSFDLDGNPRKVGVIDMGAYEFAPVCPPGNILYVNTAANGNNNGTSWTDAYTKLQDALSSTCAGINQIWVAKGTYYPDEGVGQTDNDRNASFVMKNNLAIYGGFAGTETQLSQRNWKTNLTILSGDIDQNDAGNFVNSNNNTYHVVLNTENGVDNSAILDGFTITGGYADNQSSSNPPVGGGMLNGSASPTVRNCTFFQNFAEDGGGMQNAGGSPVIINCIFKYNTYSGMHNVGSSPTVTGCSFYNNTGSTGAGMYNQEKASPIVTNCTFSGNTGGTAGAAMTNIAQSSPTVSNCIFWGDGSEIFVQQEDSRIILTNCIIQGGFAGMSGTDPLFVNAATGDLRLQSCSPAIDAGDDGLNSQATDLDGNNRKVDAIAGGNKIDMGAFEYQGTLPSATISGTATVCQGTTTSPNITFTASGGSGHYTFNYTLNGVSGSVTTISGNSITVAAPPDIIGTFTYVLLNVQDDVSNCPQNVSNQTATIKVNGLPDAQISGGPATVCENGNAPMLFLSGPIGTSGYVFYYSIFDGTSLTKNSVIGNPAFLPVPTGTPGNFTYSIFAVVDLTTNCELLVNGQSTTISVVPLPQASISAGSPVTAASSGNSATVPDAGSGATYAWTITNGAITSGTGTNSITYKAGNSGSVSLGVSVTNANNCGPEFGSANITITPLPCPNASITVPAFVCSGSANNQASVADAGTGAIYKWTITNGTITSGSGTKSISYTAAVNKFADYDDDDYVKLSVTVTNASQVCTQLSGIYKVFISPIPSATINTTSIVCSKSTGNVAWVASAGSGATYNWTISNGTITAGAGTKTILYTAGISGSVSLAVTVTNSKSCSGSSGTKTIPIASLLTANLTAATSVCAGSGGNIASVTNGGTGAKYCWSISNGCINSGSSTNTITYTVGSSGSVILTVLVTNSSGCSVPLVSKQVSILVPPNAAINTASSVCGGSSNTATATPGASGYSWTISNGTITHGAGTNSITYTAGSSGTVYLAVTVTNSNSCKSTAKSSVSIKAAPSAAISTSTPVCTASAGNIASVNSAGSGATYAWTISNGTIISGAGTAAIKYTAGSSGTVSLGITVTVSGGCKSTGNKSFSITTKVTPSFAAIGTLCQGSKAPVLPATSTNGIKGSWSPSSISTSSTGTKTYTFTPSSGQCAVSVSKTITVQKCTSTNDAGPATAKVITTEVTAPILDAVILPNPSQTWFTLLIKGSRKEIAEIRVFDLLGRPLDHLKANTGESVQFGGRYMQGMYVVEVMQGPERKVLKALKQ